MFNSSGKSGHPCLVLDLSGNAFGFSSMRMMLAVIMSYVDFKHPHTGVAGLPSLGTGAQRARGGQPEGAWKGSDHWERRL